MPSLVPRFGLAHGALLTLLACGTAVAVTPSRLIDFGSAPPGTVDTVEFEARNMSCNPPQTFRFQARDMPWLKFKNGTRLPNIERGKAKRLPVEIDLTGLKPGRYTGRIEVTCETCGDFTLSECHLDQGSMDVEIQVEGALQPRLQQHPAPVSSFSR